MLFFSDIEGQEILTTTNKSQRKGNFGRVGKKKEKNGHSFVKFSPSAFWKVLCFSVFWS